MYWRIFFNGLFGVPRFWPGYRADTSILGRPPLLSRGDRSLTFRLRRDHEILSSIINSLLTSGQLMQTAPGVWKIVLLP